MSSLGKKRVIPFVDYYLNRFALPGQRILDIGCGTAQYRNSTQAIYVGLDYTDEPYADGTPREVDIVASATNMPEPSESYDLIFSVCAFYQIPESRKTLHEFFRLLKPGGRVLLFDYNRRTQKRLEFREGAKRPCWTQWELRRMIESAGFRNCQLLVPRVCREVRGFERLLRLVVEEFVGTWVIVTGIR